MPLITKGKTNFGYVLFVAVLAIIAGGFILGYYYFWMIELEARLVEIEAQLPIVKTPKDETVDWKIYRNTFDNYLIKYPSTWYFYPTEEEGSGTTISEANLLKIEELPDPYDVNHLWINIVAYKNENNQSIQEWLEEYEAGEVKSQESIFLSGASAVKRIESGNPTFVQMPVEVDVITVYAQRDGKIYRINDFPWNSKFIPIFNKMISTFKFLN